MSERRTIRVVRHDTGEALELWEGTPSIGICEAPTCGCDEEIDGERLRVLSIEGTPTLDGDPDIGWTAVVAKVEVNGEARTRSCVTLAHTIYCGEDEPEAAFIAIDDEWVRCHAETWRMRAARFDATIREASEALAVIGAGRNDGQSLADALRALGPSVLRCARCGAFLSRGQGIVRASADEPRAALDPHQALCLACDREVGERSGPPISSRPGRLGGAPCISGTRLPVASLRALWRGGHTVSGILRLYPYLKREQVDAALALTLAEDDTVPPPAATTTAPLAHSSEPGDVCPACSDVLGSPSPCAISHDFAPGAYPPPEPDLEPAVGDEPKGAP